MKLRMLTLALIAIVYLSVGTVTKVTEGQSEEEVIHYLPSNPTNEKRDNAIRELQLIVGTHFDISILVEQECSACVITR